VSSGRSLYNSPKTYNDLPLSSALLDLSTCFLSSPYECPSTGPRLTVSVPGNDCLVCWIFPVEGIVVFLKPMSRDGSLIVSCRLRSYDEETIADDFAEPLYLHTRQWRSGVQEVREVCMKSEKEIVALLREIRDFVQILVVREQLSTSLDSDPPVQRNGRSWLLWGHRTHPRHNNQADETTTGS
jgi:hypothetical protein